MEELGHLSEVVNMSLYCKINVMELFYYGPQSCCIAKHCVCYRGNCSTTYFHFFV
jgi:hypothetical protein